MEEAFPMTFVATHFNTPESESLASLEIRTDRVTRLDLKSKSFHMKCKFKILV